MSTSPNPLLRRRSLLFGAAGLAVGAAAGCTAETAGTPTDPAEASQAISKLLPNYVEFNPVQPAFASVNGTAPVYKTYPKEPVVTVPQPPGKGSSFSLMVPVSAGVPPTLPENKYYSAMNEALNAKFTVNAFLMAEASAKYATLLASPKDVPDWTVITTAGQPARFDEAVEACFEDLTPYLAGSAVEPYRNLATITSETWQSCVFNGKLMSLPYPRASFENNALFYRKDILDKRGLGAPKSAADLLALAKELTDPAAKMWGIDTPWAITQYIFGVVPMWKLDGGKLVHRYETEEYAAALEYTVSLFKAGVVHPDALSKTGNPRTRFTAANSILYPAGLPGWRETLVNVRDSVPGFDMQVFPMFHHDGGKPIYYWMPPTSMNSFIKKGTSPDRITELLGIANYLAAPFGTKEFQMVRYGLPEVHHTLNASGSPVQTERFQREYRGTFLYPCAPNRPEAETSLPAYLDALITFLKDTSQYIVKPEFFGRNISVPADLTGLDQQMIDFENDLFANRKSMSDLKAAISQWQGAGGNQLRDFYGKYRDQ